MDLLRRKNKGRDYGDGSTESLLTGGSSGSTFGGGGDSLMDISSRSVNRSRNVYFMQSTDDDRVRFPQNIRSYLVFIEAVILISRGILTASYARIVSHQAGIYYANSSNAVPPNMPDKVRITDYWNHSEVSYHSTLAYFGFCIMMIRFVLWRSGAAISPFNRSNLAIVELAILALIFFSDCYWFLHTKLMCRFWFTCPFMWASLVVSFLLALVGPPQSLFRGTSKASRVSPLKTLENILQIGSLVLIGLISGIYYQPVSEISSVWFLVVDLSMVLLVCVTFSYRKLFIREESLLIPDYSRIIARNYENIERVSEEMDREDDRYEGYGGDEMPLLSSGYTATDRTFISNAGRLLGRTFRRISRTLHRIILPNLAPLLFPVYSVFKSLFLFKWAAGVFVNDYICILLYWLVLCIFSMIVSVSRLFLVKSLWDNHRFFKAVVRPLRTPRTLPSGRVDKAIIPHDRQQIAHFEQALSKDWISTASSDQ